jgi:hypothetical protein
MARRLTVVIVSALAILAPAEASATHLTGTGDLAGPTVAWGFNDDWGVSNGAFTADTATRHAQIAGAIMPDSLSANRFHVQWADVQPKNRPFNWRRTDAVYAAMREHSVRPIMMLFNAPGWARDPAATCPSALPCGYPPAAQYDDKWRAFVKGAVKRYREVRAIEIWNEANLGRFWAPAADPVRYSALLESAWEEARAARSSVPILVGGLVRATTNGTNMAANSFLDQVYANAGSGAFDGIGSHPYPHQAPYVERMWTRLDALRGVRDRYGDVAPLWITEIGVSSDPVSGVPLEQQGDVLLELYRSIEGHDVSSFVIHRLHDIGSEGSYWDQFGVLDQDLAPKPAYCELGTSIGTPCAGGPG